MPSTAASHRPLPTARRQLHSVGSKSPSASGAGGYRRGRQPHPETTRPAPGRCLDSQRPPPDALRPPSVHNITRSWGDEGDTHFRSNLAPIPRPLSGRREPAHPGSRSPAVMYHPTGSIWSNSHGDDHGRFWRWRKHASHRRGGTDRPDHRLCRRREAIFTGGPPISPGYHRRGSGRAGCTTRADGRVSRGNCRHTKPYQAEDSQERDHGAVG